ncbi:peptidylprolyl isomerase [Lacinutrix sp. 5H-3-7-4]|uniref:peptidylprolyl isomerase n=1 Tax=Lacinutrix sp. (strain 5H-3-7-4) TaxID=983544 RepID=UPI00020A3958|nr:peptidylprolyl isomerase [Lacinutrix sp. 5H-3-7-4]AEH00425.1 PpiC-type peptidyl-prolyl cis-trans isomerase [Lacinutrix sp. 5H-3-7-4]
MAILNKIRQKTVVLILVIALALFAFILSSLFDNKDALFNKSPNVVATINGKDISREAFMARVEAQNNPNATQTQIMNQVYNAEVREAVMQSQFDKLGLTVGREQMRDLLKTNLASSPQFFNADGIFDENVLNNYIANLKETSPVAYRQWINYENQVSSGALQQNYINMVKAATTATLAEGALSHKLEGDKVDIKYVYVPFTTIADSTVTVSKSEINAYIKENKTKYDVEASRNLQYVKFEEVASVEDENAIQGELIKLIQNREEYVDGKNQMVAGFAEMNVENAEAYVNANSDAEIKYQDKFVYKSSLPRALQDSISNLNVGNVYGPYKDGQTFKITKLLEKRQLADSIQSSHILIPFVGSQAATAETTKTKEEAKATADSIFKLVKNNKTKYAEVANEINTDGSKGKDGSIGWTRLTTYNPLGFDPDFANFLFFNDKGSIDVVLTKFGYHIIRIDDKKNVDTAYKVATIERKIEPSVKTEDDIFRNASNFEVALDGKDFLDVAKENNLKVNPVTSVKELDENIPGVGAERPIVRWAFEEDTKVGNTKRFETKDGYVIVQVTAKNEAGLMNVEDASVTALPEIRKQKKAKMIKDRVNATTLEDFAAAENQQVRTALAINMKNPTVSGVGLEPIVVGHAFGLNEGETSGLIAGTKGVFMVQPTKKTPAVELENYQSFANQVSSEKLNAVNTRLYNALKEAADIEDNRAKTVQ